MGIPINHKSMYPMTSPFSVIVATTHQRQLHIATLLCAEMSEQTYMTREVTIMFIWHRVIFLGDIRIALHKRLLLSYTPYRRRPPIINTNLLSSGVSLSTALRCMAARRSHLIIDSESIAMAHAEPQWMERPRSHRRQAEGDAEASQALGAHGSTMAGDAKELYFALQESESDSAGWGWSRRFLLEQLERASHASDDLPDDYRDLASWVTANSAAVGQQYPEYLADRRSGADRRYFRTESQALYFLRAIAPTKLVDGAWLHGVVSHWRDARYAELIRIYLEELGNGEADKNHVVIYRKLLATHDCERWETLGTPYFVQGAIQLAMARHAEEFLPEIIGFNLGYEQLPLHLLICAYELNELGIDPHYFKLHVTIDNAASGHAARAVRAVKDAMPSVGNRALYYQRLRNGYRLNAMGISTTDIIAGFHLEQELLEVLGSKAAAGANLHSDYCRIAGKTVNEWLATPGQMRGFVDSLEQAGWIRRHEDPENSRFWTLIVGDKAPMFGVFNAYDRQVIYDWIAGNRASTQRSARTWYRNQERALRPSSSVTRLKARPLASGSLRVDRPCANVGDLGVADECDDDTRLLQDALDQAESREAAMDLLVPWLSPAHHASAPGLMATRLFSQGMRE